MYKNLINTLLGVVVIGVAFLNLSAATLMWTLGIVGAIITFANLWSLLVEQDVTDTSISRQM